jgi:hypothetical protein
MPFSSATIRRLRHEKTSVHQRPAPAKSGQRTAERSPIAQDNGTPVRTDGQSLVLQVRGDDWPPASTTAWLSSSSAA